MSRDLDELSTRLSSSNRRTLLKQLGVSTTAGLFGGAALTSGVSPVAAGGGEGGTTSGGPGVGTDQVIPAPDGAGMTNAEWDATNQEQDDQSSVNLGNYPNAGELPIDYCIDLPNGNELCSDAGETIIEGTRDCSSGTTPVLVSTDVTIQEYEFGYLKTEVSIWIGYNPQTDCLWVGQEDAGACKQLSCSVEDAKDSLLSYTAGWVDILQGVVGWIENNWAILVGGAMLTAAAIAVIVLPIGAIIAGLLAAAAAAVGS